MLAVTVVAALIAAGAIAALFSSKGKFAAERTKLQDEIARLTQEKTAIQAELGDFREKLSSEEGKLPQLNGQIKSLQGQVAELQEKLTQAEKGVERARIEQTSQRAFFARKARDTFEVFKQKIAAEGFPERIEDLDKPGAHKTLSDEAKRILKDIESWMEQGGLDDANILHVLARIDYARGDAKRAELRLRAASRTTSDPLLWENLGDLMRLTGRNKRAIEGYKNAAKNSKEDSGVFKKLGLALFASSDYSAAVKPLMASLATNTGDLDLHLKTARALIESGDYQRAVDLTHQAAKKFTKAPEVPALAVVAFAKMKRFADAQRYYQKAIDIDPKSPDAHIARGFAYLDEGKTADAVTSFTKALAADPKREDAYYGLGTAANRTQNWEEALRNLKKAVELKPEYAEGWYAMKTTFEGLKKFESAVEALNKAVTLNPHLTA